MPTIVAVSDTHGLHDQIEIPAGDVLVHAGDLTRSGRLEQVEAFNDWLGGLPHRCRIVVAGNHDWCFQRRPAEARARLTNAIYLEDAAATIDGVKFYGSPWQPEFCDWAFNLARGEELAAKWAMIPDDVDVLVTHGPPFGIGDRTLEGVHVGCADLRRRVDELQPPIHLFGHIHEAAGLWRLGSTTFVNASSFGESHVAVLDLPPRKAGARP